MVPRAYRESTETCITFAYRDGSPACRGRAVDRYLQVLAEEIDTPFYMLFRDGDHLQRLLPRVRRGVCDGMPITRSAMRMKANSNQAVIQDFWLDLGVPVSTLSRKASCAVR